MRTIEEYKGYQIESTYLSDGDFLVTVKDLKTGKYTRWNYWTVGQAKAAIDRRELGGKR